MSDKHCNLDDREIEANIGEEIPDPWDDETQLDWPSSGPIQREEIED